jgi:hypothetical protein
MPQIHPHLAALPAELRQLADAATTGPASGAALLQKLRAAQVGGGGGGWVGGGGVGGGARELLTGRSAA